MCFSDDHTDGQVMIKKEKKKGYIVKGEGRETNKKIHPDISSC